MRKALFVILCVLLSSGIVLGQESGLSPDHHDSETLRVHVGERDPSFYFRLGAGFQASGDLENAYRAYRKSLVLGNEEPWRCHYRMAAISLKQGNQRKEQEHLGLAFELENSALVAERAKPK